MEAILDKVEEEWIAKLLVPLHLPQRKPVGLHHKCKTMLLAVRSMMLMMKMIWITSKYITVQGDSEVIYVVYLWFLFY